MIDKLRTALLQGRTCQFRVRSHVLMDETTYKIECRMPFSAVFQPLWKMFGYDIYTRPRTNFRDYDQAVDAVRDIIERGYEWNHEKQCYLINGKKEPESWKSPTRLRLKMQLSSAGAIAFSTL